MQRVKQKTPRVRLTTGLLAQLRNNDPHLATLYLEKKKNQPNYRWIEDPLMQELVQILENNAAVQLKTFNLRGQKIDNKGVRRLASALEKNRTLISLSLGHNKIGDGAQALASALRINNTLVELNLSKNKLGDHEAVALASALRQNTTLRKLSLKGTNISDRGASELARALEEENFTLTKLNLDGCPISQPIKEKINQILARNNQLKEDVTPKASGDSHVAASHCESCYVQAQLRNVEAESIQHSIETRDYRSASLQPRFGSQAESIHQTVSSSKLHLGGLKYQPIPGDGHCLFNAVALHVGQTQEWLRRFVAAHLEHNLDDFRDFLQPPEGKSVEDYIDDVRNGIEWASHVEIEVLMRLLDRPIMVVDPNGNLRNADDAHRFRGKPIFVYYNGHNHYDALLLTGERDARAVLNNLLLPQAIASQQPLTQFSGHSLQTGRRSLLSAPVAKPPEGTLEERAFQQLNQLKKENAFQKLLKNIKRTFKNKDIHPPRCFISYAWEDESTPAGRAANKQMQRWLERLTGHLRELNMSVFFDLHDLHGNVRDTMYKGINDSDYFILICTPRWKQRIEAGLTPVLRACIENGRVEELEAGLWRVRNSSPGREDYDPKNNATFEFIHIWLKAQMVKLQSRLDVLIPLRYTGSFEEAVLPVVGRELVRNVEGIHENAEKHYELLVGLSAPLGIIPAIYQLRREGQEPWLKEYQPLVANFKNKLKNIDLKFKLAQLQIQQPPVHAQSLQRTQPISAVYQQHGLFPVAPVSLSTRSSMPTYSQPPAAVTLITSSNLGSLKQWQEKVKVVPKDHGRVEVIFSELDAAKEFQQQLLSIGIYNFNEPGHPRKIDPRFADESSNNNNNQDQFVLTLTEWEYNEICENEEAYERLVSGTPSEGLPFRF